MSTVDVDRRAARRARRAWRRIQTANRATELGLIILVALIVVAAYVLASLGKTASLPVNLGPFLLIVLGLFLAGHFALRMFAPRADPVLLPVAGLLNGLGYVVIVRLNHQQAGQQAIWTFVGMAAFVGTLILVRRIRDLDRYRYLLGFGGVGLLLLPLVPGIGEEIGGSRVWVHLGPLNFEPGEIAKVALLIFCASYLGEKGVVLAENDRRVGIVPLPDLRALGPVTLAWAMSIVIMVAEHDLGMSLLYFALFITMLYIGTSRRRYLAAGLGLFAMAAYFSYPHIARPARTGDHPGSTPWKTAQSSGFQLVQAMYAFAAGGTVGTGLALGSPSRIPAVQTDFIFAAIGEKSSDDDRHRDRAAGVPYHRQRRPAHRGAQRAPVRQTPRRRCRDHLRVPDVHHRERRDPAPAADGHHPPVRVVRRIVADHQLHPGGGPVAEVSDTPMPTV